MAAMTARERRELYSSTIQRLTEVIGASGKADELVKLTTQIVQAAKKMAQDTPDAMKNRSMATLAEFVIAAKKIAQDPRAVDAASLQKLSSAKKAVEAVVKELDAWLTSQASSEDTDISLEDILSQTSAASTRADHHRSSVLVPNQGGGSRRASPTDGGGPVVAVSELERRLLSELKQQQEVLAKKAEPQAKPVQHGDPEQTLKVAVAGLSRSSSQLMDLAGQKAPSKESLLEPATTLAKMVSILMDLVDTLFVSKFPMRSQVHTFSCMLVDNVVAYGDQSKTEDTASLRLVSTQAPALMSALEVMVEQCYKRSLNIRESQQMSLQRNVDLHDLDVFGAGNSPRNSPGLKKRKEPPTPPTKAVPPPQVKEFDICVMICSSVAVDSTSQSLLNKGTEISVKATPTTSVKEVRGLLAQRTGIAKDSIQLRFRGDDVLADDAQVTPDNPLPYFMFNLHEPGEEEMTEFRKDQKRKNRLRIDTKDWSRVPSPVAVAIYDYEAIAEPGEDDNLEFEEGDLIEITERSADGWWTGRVDGNVGVFPASFVEMIQKPATKDERKRLLKRFQQGTLGAVDVVEQEPPPRPPEPKATSHVQQAPPSSSSKIGSMNKMFGRSHHSSTGSDTSDTAGSPSPTKIPASFGRFVDRRTSAPTTTETKEKEGKQKKRTSFFKKKHTNSSSYISTTDDFQRSPILPYKHRESVPVIQDLDEEIVKVQSAVPRPQLSSAPVVAPAVAPAVAPTVAPTVAPAVSPASFRPLHRPKSSPRLALKGSGGRAPPVSSTPPKGIGGGVAMPSVGTTHPRGSGGGVAAPSKGGDAKTPTEAEVADLASVKRRRPPPPPPPAYAKTYGAQGLHSLVRRQPSDGAEREALETTGREHESAAHSQTLPLPDTPSPDLNMPISMKVTPASPVLSGHVSGDAQPSSIAEEEEEEVMIMIMKPISSSGSMEALLEEFDDFSSTQSLTNGFLKTGQGNKKERDYATIPRSELPVPLDSSEEEEEEEEEEKTRPASVPAAMSTPPFVEDRPCLTPSPLLTGSASTSSKADPVAPPPIKPVRSRSKRLRLKKQMMEEETSEQSPQQPTTPPSPPPPGQFSPPQAPPCEPLPQTPPEPRPPRPRPPHLGKASSPKVDRPVFRSPKPPSMPPPEAVENGMNKMGATPSPQEKGLIPPSPGEKAPRSPSPGEKGPKPPSPREMAPSSGEKRPKPPPGENRPKPSVPTAPPRKKTRSLKRPTKDSPAGGPPSRPPVPVKPKTPQVTRTSLEVMDKPLSCSSAPVSRTASPEDGGGLGDTKKLRQESSLSSSNLCSAGVGVAKGRAKEQALSYKTAMKCISYLSSDNLVRKDRLLASAAGNSVLIKRLLDAIDNLEEIDLNSLHEAPSVLGLLLSLYDERHLGCVLSHDLSADLCSSMQGADPITLLGAKLELLEPDNRRMLKKLLQLFGKVLKYSDKNNTEMADIDKVFSPIVFEGLSSAQSEPVLAYLISTCDFIIT